MLSAREAGDAGLQQVVPAYGGLHGKMLPEFSDNGKHGAHPAAARTAGRPWQRYDRRGSRPSAPLSTSSSLGSTPACWRRSSLLGHSPRGDLPWRGPRASDQGTRNTNIKTKIRSAIPALIGLGLAAVSASALADAKDYEFQLVQQEIKKGDATLAVRLINKKTGQPVPDAVITAKRLDMAPDAMPTMTTPLEALPSTEPGVYRFKANLTMQGGWQLSLGAKVQGETGTVESKLVLKALP
jgi:hypothetical protein